MRKLIIILLFVSAAFVCKAQNEDHWLILVNGLRVFECPSTCSANGLNLAMLKVNVKLKSGDKVTIVYGKEVIEKKITKIITVTDTTTKKFQNFSIYDDDGTHAVTIKSDDFMAFEGIVIWYSEKKMVNGKEVITKKIPLVYFE